MIIIYHATTSTILLCEPNYIRSCSTVHNYIHYVSIRTTILCKPICNTSLHYKTLVANILTPRLL